MALQCYVNKDFKQSTMELINVINSIVTEYQDGGYILTVRQLYYQLVARDIIPNNLREYKRAASIINDGKLAGLIDWDAIEDRTREFISRSRWNNGAQILRSAVNSYHQDMWINQSNRVFVIVEKEALVGILERVCHEYDVPLLAARGYPSGSVLRSFAEDEILPAINNDQHIHILHLGDHDPSGIDMTRDIKERLNLFVGDNVNIERIALNMNQIEEQNPPENPAKTTDSRFDSYKNKFGTASWELDALSPQYLSDLISKHISIFIDDDKWQRTINEISSTKQRIIDLAKNFEG